MMQNTHVHTVFISSFLMFSKVPPPHPYSSKATEDYVTTKPPVKRCQAQVSERKEFRMA